MLELFDFLGSPVVEDFEVALREVGNRRLVTRRGVDVDPHVVRLGPEVRGERLISSGLAGAGGVRGK